MDVVVNTAVVALGGLFGSGEKSDRYRVNFPAVYLEVRRGVNAIALRFPGNDAVPTVPDSPFFVSPTLIADQGWLHLEGRYNYEERRTGSLWFGYNFSVGQRLTLEATPMIGGVFGKVPGVAPGYELTLSYRRLEITTTGRFQQACDQEER